MVHAFSKRLVPVTVLAALAFVVLIASPAVAESHSWTYSPLPAVGVGPSGPATAKIKVEPYCCPSTAIVVTASSKVGEGDFQWVNLGLATPIGPAIESVEVCYSVKSAERGATYISQTRLTDMTTPDAAHVRMDDPTDRRDPGPTCYKTKAGFSPKGTITLALKVVIAQPGDEIRIGMVRINRSSTEMMRMEKKPMMDKEKMMKEKGAGR